MSDQALNYACPKCGAVVDVKCHTLGKPANTKKDRVKYRSPHIERVRLARGRGPHYEQTLAYLAFAQRKPYRVGSGMHIGMHTDGTTLRDRWNVIAWWSDQTRVVISNERHSSDAKPLERFLDYWQGYYHIGVSYGTPELVKA